MTKAREKRPPRPCWVGVFYSRDRFRDLLLLALVNVVCWSMRGTRTLGDARTSLVTGVDKARSSRPLLFMLSSSTELA
jgi:hypothetical protein